MLCAAEQLHWKSKDTLMKHWSFTKRFGAENATTLVAAHNKACGLLGGSSTREIQEAITMLRMKLKVETARLGQNHPAALSTRASLALCLARLGSLAKARQELDDVLLAQTEAAGVELLDHAATKHARACVMHLQGHHEEALREFQEVLSMRRDALGEHHLDTLTTQSYIAATMEVVGRTEEAEQAFLEVLERQRAALGQTHSTTMATMYALATLLHRAGSHLRALTVCEEILATSEKKCLPDRDSERMNAFHLSISLLEGLGRLDEAAKRCEDLWKSRVTTYGAKHQTTLTTRAHLASLLAGQGKLDDTIKIYREVLKHQEETLGDTHPQTLISLHNLAWALQKQRSNGREVQQLARVLRHRRQTAQANRQDKELLRLGTIRDKNFVFQQLTENLSFAKDGEPVFDKLTPHMPL